MPLTLLSSPLSTLPAGADGVSVTPSGTVWNNSAWVQLTPSLSAAALLVSFTVRAGQDSEFELEVGQGAAGAETVVATITSRSNQVLGTSGYLATLHLPIPIDALPAGARVAIRLRKTLTSVTAWVLAITVAYKPVSGSLLTTTKPTKPMPSAAAKANAASGTTAWASGAWVQLVASTSAAWVIVAISANARSEFEVDIGVGAAGAEVVRHTMRDETASTSPGAMYYLALPTPLDAIPSGSRVAVRSRNSAASGSSLGCPVGVTYLEKPL